MAKKVKALVKLQITGGAANPSPPVGPALGQQGVNIMEFCKAFNAKTQPIMQKMIDEGFNYYAYQIKDSRYYDTGDKLEYLKTVIDFGLMHDELGPDLEAFIRTRIS